jgi:dihydrofolate reductase
MRISIIVAMDEARGIGRDNRLPWHLSADLKRFKSLTMGHHIVMGRKTYASIGRPLPGRTTIVVTRQSSYRGLQGECSPPHSPSGKDCLVVNSLRQALDLAGEQGEAEVFVIGGSEIFAQALGQADRIYLTQVHAKLPTDVQFPPLNLEHWVETARDYHPADEKNEYPFHFRILERGTA